MMSVGCINYYLPLFKIMWDNFRVKRQYNPSTTLILSLLGKPVLTLHPEAVSFFSACPHFLAQIQNTGWVTWSTTIINIGNVISLSPSSFAVSNIQATVWGTVTAASAISLLDEPTNQPR